MNTELNAEPAAHPIDKAARLVGSQVALAALLGVSKAAVNQWKDPERKVPTEHCPLIERATSGAVRCEALRPDVAWGRIPDKAWPHPKGRPVIEVSKAGA